MSYASGMAAIKLEFTEKVPRVEYSVESHWEVLRKVTGIDTSKIENRDKAQREFITAWDYAFIWSTPVGRNFLQRQGGRTTNMGHAVYAELKNGQADYNDNITQGFKNLDEIFALDPVEEYGIFDQQDLITELETTYRNACERIPRAVNMGGVYITMVSGFIDMFGWDMFLTALGYDQKKFGRVIAGYYEWVKQFFEAYAKSNVPVFMCHDDICWTSGPVAHPDWYREYVFPYYKKLWAPLKSAGKKVLYTSDGNYTEFFDDIVACGADMVVMEPLSDMAAFAGKYGKTHGFVGNADTRILLRGSKEDIYREVKRCMDIGKPYPGFIMAVGNHIPQNTPVDNVLYYNKAYEELSKR